MTKGRQLHTQTLELAPAFLSPISPVISHAKTCQMYLLCTVTYTLLNTLGLVRSYGTSKMQVYADSESSAYLHGTWSKTKKYRTVILAYLRYVSTRIIAPWLKTVWTKISLLIVFVYERITLWKELDKLYWRLCVPVLL
jgi:hypothetical protein